MDERASLSDSSASGASTACEGWEVERLALDEGETLYDSRESGASSACEAWEAEPLDWAELSLHTPHHEVPFRLESPQMLTNCSESDEAVYVSCELPNVKIEDINVDFNERTRELRITAESRPEPLRAGEVFCRQERLYGPMSRTYALPGMVTSDGATVHFDNTDGILRVAFRKNLTG